MHLLSHTQLIMIISESKLILLEGTLYFTVPVAHRADGRELGELLLVAPVVKWSKKALFQKFNIILKIKMSLLFPAAVWLAVETTL